MKYSFNENFELRKGELVYKFTQHPKTNPEINQAIVNIHGEITEEGTAAVSVWACEDFYLTDTFHRRDTYSIFVRVTDAKSNRIFKDGVKVKQITEGDLFEQFIKTKNEKTI